MSEPKVKKGTTVMPDNKSEAKKNETKGNC